MTVEYCSIDQVIARLGIIDPQTQQRLVPSGNGSPLELDIENFIEEAQDEIDRETWHSWRSTNVVEEYHSINQDYIYDYTFIEGVYAVPVRLFHRNLTAMVSPTDKLEYFDGNSWVDILATGNPGAGYGAGDFWVDLQEGIVFLFSFIPRIGRNTFRATYRYGDATVPGDIRKACSLLAAINIIESDIYSRHFPDNTSHINLQVLVTNFQKKYDTLISRRREFVWV